MNARALLRWLVPGALVTLLVASIVHVSGSCNRRLLPRTELEDATSATAASSRNGEREQRDAERFRGEGVDPSLADQVPMAAELRGHSVSALLEPECVSYRGVAFRCDPVTPVGFSVGVDAIDSALSVYAALESSPIEFEVRVVDSIGGEGHELGGFIRGDEIFISVRRPGSVDFYSPAVIESFVHHELSSLVYRLGMSDDLGAAWHQCLPPEFEYVGGSGMTVLEVDAAARAVVTRWEADDRTLAEQGFVCASSLRSMEEDFNRLAAAWITGDASERHRMARDTLVLYKLGIMREAYAAIGLDGIDFPRVHIPRRDDESPPTSRWSPR